MHHLSRKLILCVSPITKAYTDMNAHQCTSMRKSTHLFTKLHIAVLLQIQMNRSIFSVPSAVSALQPGLLFAVIGDKHCFCLMSADLCQCSRIDQVIASRFLCRSKSRLCHTPHTPPVTALLLPLSPQARASTHSVATDGNADRSLACPLVRSFICKTATASKGDNRRFCWNPLWKGVTLTTAECDRSGEHIRVITEKRG